MANLQVSPVFGGGRTWCARMGEWGLVEELGEGRAMREEGEGWKGGETLKMVKLSRLGEEECSYLHDVEELVVDGWLVGVDDLDAFQKLDGAVKFLLLLRRLDGNIAHASHAHGGHSRIRHSL